MTTKAKKKREPSTKAKSGLTPEKLLKMSRRYLLDDGFRLSSAAMKLTIDDLQHLLHAASMLQENGQLHNFDAESFLRNSGVAKENLQLLLEGNGRLNEVRDAIVENRFDLEAIRRYLAIAPEQAHFVRELLNRGYSLSADKLTRLATELEEFTTNDQVAALKAGRAKLFADLFEKAEAAVTSFEEQAAELATLCRVFEDDNVREKARVKPLIVKEAGALLKRFLELHGDAFTEPESWLDVDDLALRAQLQAHYALKILSAGSFGEHLPRIDPLRDFPPMGPIVLQLPNWRTLDSVLFLAGRTDGRTSLTRFKPRKVTPLRAVEVDPIVGCQTLGLISAGFEIERLIAKERKTVKSIERARFKWTVSPYKDGNLSKVVNPEEKPLDLLVLNLPMNPWCFNADGEHSVAQRHTAAMELIGKAEPKAFYFEIHEDMTKEKHLTFFTNMTSFFARKGYHYEVFKLRYEDFGLPQSKEGHFFVAVKKQFASQLREPYLRRPRHQAVGDAIRDIAFPHYRPEPVVPTIRPAPLQKSSSQPAELSVEQVNYNEWISAWLNSHGAKKIENVSSGRSEKQKNIWSDYGFSLPAALDRRLTKRQQEAQAKKMDQPLGLTELPPELLIPLTTDVIRALQGIPHNWEIVGTYNERRKWLCKSTPPIIATAIARSIHAAITGEVIDLDQPGALTAYPTHKKRPSPVQIDVENARTAQIDCWKRGLKAMKTSQAATMHDEYYDDQDD